MTGKKSLSDEERRRKRLAYLMRRLLRGTDTSSQDMSRAEYKMLLALGFPVQGEQSFGDMAGSGRTWYFVENDRMEEARRAYERFTGEKPPLPDPGPTRPVVPYGPAYVCCVCDRSLYRKKAPPVILNGVPICPRCAREVAEKAATLPEIHEDEGKRPSLAEMISDLTWRQDVWANWTLGLNQSAYEMREALLARGFEPTGAEAMAVWRWYCRTHLGKERLPRNEEEASTAVDAFLKAWKNRTQHPAMMSLWPAR